MSCPRCGREIEADRCVCGWSAQPKAEGQKDYNALIVKRHRAIAKVLGLDLLAEWDAFDRQYRSAWQTLDAQTWQEKDLAFERWLYARHDTQRKLESDWPVALSPAADRAVGEFYSGTLRQACKLPVPVAVTVAARLAEWLADEARVAWLVTEHCGCGRHPHLYACLVAEAEAWSEQAKTRASRAVQPALADTEVV
jgi:hypothetical protein